jgi:cytochrome P450
MTKLRRSCLESLRLTAHSIGGVRTAQQDVTVSVGSKTYKIPKGSSISLSHIVTHRDTSIWGNDASEFDISSSSRLNNSRRGDDVDLYRDEYKFTTFSHGVHICPGQQLALLILQLIVAVLLVEYEVILPDDIPPLDFERATLAQRAKPVMVTISPVSKMK